MTDLRRCLLAGVVLCWPAVAFAQTAAPFDSVSPLCANTGDKPACSGGIGLNQEFGTKRDSAAAIAAETAAQTTATAAQAAAANAAAVAAAALSPALLGAANGIATLDSTSNVPLSELGNVPTAAGGGVTSVAGISSSIISTAQLETALIGTTTGKSRDAGAAIAAESAAATAAATAQSTANAAYPTSNPSHFTIIGTTTGSARDAAAAITAENNASSAATAAQTTASAAETPAALTLTLNSYGVLHNPPTATTQAAGDSSNDLATDLFANSAIGLEATRAMTAEALRAPLASPMFTGTPSAPTPSAGTDTTQLATMHAVNVAVAAATGVSPSTATIGISAAGTNLSTATGLTSNFNQVTSCTGGVIMPSGVAAGQKLTINNDCSTSLTVYPDSSSDNFYGLGAGVALTMAPNSEIIPWKMTAAEWHQ